MPTWPAATVSATDDDVTTYDPTPSTSYTKGKLAVDTPVLLYKDELSYRNKGFFSNISADYMSKRYYSYDNTGFAGNGPGGPVDTRRLPGSALAPKKLLPARLMSVWPQTTDSPASSTM